MLSVIIRSVTLFSHIIYADCHMLSAITLSVIMLISHCAECHYAECHYADKALC
jgi:hypothetical protein